MTLQSMLCQEQRLGWRQGTQGGYSNEPYKYACCIRFVLGDSAYPQSCVMMTPYQMDQIYDDHSKNLFNVRHSAARMEMTEHIYGELIFHK